MVERTGKLRLIDGIFVRSRLEAKWLRFFKLLEIDFVYEPERFPDGITNIGYLPDVFLTETQVYVEIKPNRMIYRREKDRPEGFVRMTGKKLIVVCGEPENCMRYLLHRGSDDCVLETRIDWEVPWRDKPDIQKQALHLQEQAIAIRASNSVQEGTLQEAVLKYFAMVAMGRPPGQH